jgi:AAA+ ATPase superfamily predicted ATPase
VFVNRHDELDALARWWREGRGPAVAWGRRRVGKTALLQHFAADLRTVFHTGAGRPVGGELAQLARQAALVTPGGGRDGRDTEARPYADWDDALDDLDRRADDQPLLVVLDEFPELVAGSPELPGVLRAFLDRNGARTGVRLLLCGSAVRHMEALQEQRAPLYGRFALSLQVHPFRPHEAALLLPGLPPAEQALVYGLVGGVPLYLSWWDAGADLAANLSRLVCRPAAPLLTEGQLVLATEAERGEYPAAVLHAIAAGRTRYGEIKDAVRAEPARTLERLAGLRLIERVSPVTDDQRSRRVCYRVADNFLAFYLQVVSRFRGEIERGLGASILPVLISCLDDFMGPRWEEMFRAHLRRLAVAGTLGEGIVAIGPWWNDTSDAEIYALALAGRSRHPILAGEAKWARSIDAQRHLEALRRKAAKLPGANPDDLAYALCAREHVATAPPDLRTFTATDIMTPDLTA